MNRLIILFCLGLSCLDISRAEDIQCKKGWNFQDDSIVIEAGDSFAFDTVNNRRNKYRKNQYCTADYVLGSSCTGAIVTCDPFNLRSNRRCTRDYLDIYDEADFHSFCRDNGPVNFRPVGDFSVIFVSDNRGSAEGFKCQISCADGSSPSTASPPTTGSSTPSTTGSSTPSTTGSSSTATPPTTTSQGTTTTAPATGSIDCTGGCSYQIQVNQVWSQEPNGYNRTAEVKVPPTNSKLPVVIDLHGNGGNANVNRLGFLRKSIIVAPQGYERSWNILKEASKAPDVNFIDSLIKEISKIEQADMDAVNIVGTSNGAGMIMRLLIELKNPRPFKRVIPLVSHMLQDQYHDGDFWMPTNDDNGAINNFDQKVTPDSPGPEILYYHGTADGAVPYEGGRGVLGMMFLGAQATTFAFAKAFGFNGAQIADNAGIEVQSGVTKYEYNGASRVVHYKMLDMPHNAFAPIYRDYMHASLISAIEDDSSTVGTTTTVTEGSTPVTGATTEASTSGSTPTPGSIDCSSGCEIQLTVNQSWSQEPNGYLRTAEVKVPATSTKLPVVIDLHGSGGNANVNRMGKFLSNSIIVAAQGYANQWNIVKENTKAPDVKFMEKLIQEIAQIQQADMDDVTVIGTSNGAGMISRMLIEMKNPRPFKRVIPMVSHLTVNQYHDGSFWMPSNDDNGATTNYDDPVVPDSPAPEIIYFHGTDDKTIPYGGGQSLGLTFLGSQETTYAYAKAFGFNGAQIADNAGVSVETGVTKYEYNGASRVVHYKMDGMSHNAFDPKYVDFVQGFIKTTIEG